MLEPSLSKLALSAIHGGYYGEMSKILSDLGITTRSPDYFTEEIILPDYLISSTNVYFGNKI